MIRQREGDGRGREKKVKKCLNPIADFFKKNALVFLQKTIVALVICSSPLLFFQTTQIFKKLSFFLRSFT